MAGADDHRRLYGLYDRRVDLVSVAEVWFTRSQSLAPYTVHFERFPRLVHPNDGRPARPDFAVLFEDDTALVGELAHIAPGTSALERLASQIGRYETLCAVPCGPPDASGLHPLREARAIDVVVFAPVNGIHQAIDELAEMIADPEHRYSPEHPPMLLSYSFDADDGSYTFQRPERGRNEHTRDHDRQEGLGSWLKRGHDELRGLPRYFQQIKASARFMNDNPPDLYIATVLWNFVLPDFAASEGVEVPANLTITEQELVERLRESYGYAASIDLVRRALEFLRVARVCEPAADGWRIYYRNLGRVSREISEALLHEHYSKANKTRRIRPAREDEPVAPDAEAERTDAKRAEAAEIGDASLFDEMNSVEEVGNQPTAPDADEPIEH